MADGLIKIQGSTNVGKCVDAINDNFEYLDGKTPAGEDILEQAKAYTNFRADAISASTNEALQARVMKETGKGLSSNDYTDEEKAKLAGIAENAAAYLPLTGGTISNSNYGESLKVNRGPTSSSAALSVIDYLINGNRVGVMGFDSDSKLRIRNSNNTEMAEIDKDGTVSAKYFKQSQSGTLLAESSTDENSLTVTNAEIAKYSLLYMAASWTQQETVNFCDVIPISAIAAGAVFTKQVYTGTRIYTYTVTCTSVELSARSAPDWDCFMCGTIKSPVSVPPVNGR